MIAAVEINYKELLIQAMQLRGRGGRNAYKRARLLVNVYEATDFIVQECGGRSDVAEAKLDAYVEDLCLTFMELRDMLRHFKRPAQWKDGRLKSMHRKMVISLASARKLDRPAAVRPPRMNGAEIKLLDERRQHAEARVAHLEREVERFQQTEAVSTVSINHNGVEHTSGTTLKGRLLNTFLSADDNERRRLIDSPEFQGWCKSHGFEVAALP